eukprot:11165152-Lingulodinium_polyedra.AAC.1
MTSLRSGRRWRAQVARASVNLTIRLRYRARAQQQPRRKLRKRGRAARALTPFCAALKRLIGADAVFT